MKPEDSMSASRDRYLISCYHCAAFFDAAASTWCACPSELPSAVCPECLSCFCMTPADYRQSFWLRAPLPIWEKRHRETVESLNEAEGNDEAPLVLIVDADPDLLFEATIAVHALGYRAVVARDGREALDIVRTRKPRIVLSDALVPRIDARELCRIIRSRPDLDEVRLVIMSPVYRARRYRPQLVRELGADGMIVKPLHLSELRDVLSQVMTPRETTGAK
jgi:CheY-like chemotaxis protein